ncbi:MAG: Hsp70 family protein, partial [Oscillospiraceae bacterium]|nr:Hsp70 family protein [Oscillospiraceae bacterium]
MEIISSNENSIGTDSLSVFDNLNTADSENITQINGSILTEQTVMSIGIDFGTTNTVVSYVDYNGKLKNISIQNSNITPSAIFFDSKERIYFGESAVNRRSKNPSAFVNLFKRRLLASSDRYNVDLKDDGTKKKKPDVYYAVDIECFMTKPDILDLFSYNETVILDKMTESIIEAKREQTELRFMASKARSSIKKHTENNDVKILFESGGNEDISDIALNKKELDPTVICASAEVFKKAEENGLKAVSLSDFLLDKISDSRETDEFTISGQEAAALFLRYIKDEVLKSLECDALKAVVTVPASFDYPEIYAVKRAAVDAGFYEVKIEKEPIAAAVAYKVEESESDTVLVYDFGGGTFDVSVIRGTDNRFEELAVSGEKNLGGEDLTNELVNYIYEKLDFDDGIYMFELERSGLSKEQYNMNTAAIAKEAERVKKSLSELESETIELLNIYSENGDVISKEIAVTRRELEEFIEDKITQTTDYLRDTLKDNNLTIDDIDTVILAGGSSLIPMVVEKVRACIGDNKNICSDKDASTLISNGAAILARSIFEGENEIEIHKSTKADYGIAAADWNFDMIISHDTLLPAYGEKEYYLESENQQLVNIKIYSRKKGSKAVKVHRMDFMEEFSLTGLPDDINNADAKVVVSFNITEEYEMEIS